MIERMVAPGDRRPNIWRQGVLQIWVTRACDLSCFGCTQGSNLRGKPGMITPEQFEQACKSLKGYFGVVGMFGGNPAIHPQFDELCKIMRATIPYQQRGLWCNNLNGKGIHARATFNPAHSNLNVHLNRKAYLEFIEQWPEAAVEVKGLDPNWPEAIGRPNSIVGDARHSPVYVAMKDVLKKDCPNPKCEDGKVLQSPFWSDGPKDDCKVCGGTGQVYDEEKALQLITSCDINRNWSAMICVFRGELRAFFCEIAAAQAMLHQNNPDYPDTGLPVTPGWWKKPIQDFKQQIDKHCHECGIPLRGYGDLAVGGVREQVSITHKDIYLPKDKTRLVELVTNIDQVKPGALPKATDYIQNGGI